MLKVNESYKKIVDRFNGVMSDICVEYLEIRPDNGELSEHRKYYDVENGVYIAWMLEEAEYWLSCYYEVGNCRCDDRLEGPECYKEWKSETGKLKRLIERLKTFNGDELVAEWA